MLHTVDRNSSFLINNYNNENDKLKNRLLDK